MVYDVIIAGGGTSGAIAGISAAREGLKTLVVETMSALGGTQTNGMVTPLMEPNVPGCEFVNSAIGEEIRSELEAAGHCEWMWFDPCIQKIVLEEKLIEAGADILFNTSVINASLRDGKIDSISVYNSDGITEIKAKVFIDCTGDADLAKMAGVEVVSGNNSGINQSASLRFEMANVRLSELSRFLKDGKQPIWTDLPTLQICNVDHGCPKIFHEKVKKAVEDGRLTETEASHIQLFSIPGRPEAINFNCPETGSGRNVSSAAEVTRRLIQGRKSILRIAAFMKSEIPGFENAYISEIAPMLGIRESERIKAEYEYGIEDIVERRRFADAITKSNYPVDVHGASQSMDKELEYKKVSPDEEYFEYPYRSIVPVGVDNLLVCGRCAGMDFYSQSAIRVQFSCQAMGEAAGLAARIAIDEEVAFKQVDGVKVREMMRARGSML